MLLLKIADVRNQSLGLFSGFDVFPFSYPESSELIHREPVDHLASLLHRPVLRRQKHRPFSIN